MDISDHAILLDQQRELQRFSNVELHRLEAESRWRNVQQDRAGEKLYKTAAVEWADGQQMRDNHRKARIKDINLQGKIQKSYATDDLMRTNYLSHYER